MNENIEQAFIKRAIELAKSIQSKTTKEDMKIEAMHLEGYLTGALEIFSTLNKLASQK